MDVGPVAFGQKDGAGRSMAWSQAGLAARQCCGGRPDCRNRAAKRAGSHQPMRRSLVPRASQGKTGIRPSNQIVGRVSRRKILILTIIVRPLSQQGL